MGLEAFQGNQIREGGQDYQFLIPSHKNNLYDIYAMSTIFPLWYKNTSAVIFSKIILCHLFQNSITNETVAVSISYIVHVLSICWCDISSSYRSTNELFDWKIENWFYEPWRLLSAHTEFSSQVNVKEPFRVNGNESARHTRSLYGIRRSFETFKRSYRKIVLNLNIFRV